MSRPQKIHQPIKGNFLDILAAVGMGSGKGKQAALKLARKQRTKKSAGKVAIAAEVKGKK